MKVENSKRRMVYLFFSVILAFIITNYSFDIKYNSKTNTIDASEGNNLAKNDDIVSISKEASQNSTSNNASQVSRKEAVLLQQKQQSVSIKVPGPVANDETQRSKDKIALKNMRKSKVNTSKTEREGRTGISPKGCLVIYNRMAADVKVSVVKPDGKKIDKKIQSLKSLQLDVPMGVYTVQAMDKMNKPICSGNVTINDELGAAYYVKL